VAYSDDPNWNPNNDAKAGLSGFVRSPVKKR
jgi:hypothetical protein